MLEILHITPHMGGGVGKVISGLSMFGSSIMNHRVILLEQPIKSNFIDELTRSGIETLICPDSLDIGKQLSESDIVVVHWWHHPKTSKFLYELPKIPLRIIIWTHISNLTVPALNPSVLLESTRVIFTTEASYEANVFKNISKELLNSKTGVVYGCPGLDDFPEVKRKTKESFNIGYLGLIDFSKLNSKFVDFCDSINILEAKFILAGDAPAKKILDKQFRAKSIKNEVIYTGYVNDTTSVLSQFDVFGYPLAHFHTCTTENVILEAMAAEVPPVLLNQLTEKYIVKNGRTGLLVSNEEEYGNAMRYLYNNPHIRKSMGKNAREYVLNKHTSKKFVDSFYINCELAMIESKKIMDFRRYIGKTPAEWFISSLGDDLGKFQKSFNAGINNQSDEMKKLINLSSPLLKQENKSSAFHYLREFPKDEMLRVWTKIMLRR